jgi:hypothetical protein
MTRSRDTDRNVDRWMDDGPTLVADRVIAAAMTEIQTTRQRGAQWAPLKEIFMTRKLAVMVVGLAAVIILGIAAYQLIPGGGLRIGGPETARTVTVAELPGIVLAANQAPEGMTHDGTYQGRDTLLRPIISVQGADAAPYIEQPGFVDGRYSEFSDGVSGLLSWAALFESVEDAERARGLYAGELQSPDGYALDTVEAIELGDAGSYYDADAQDSVQVYLWRVENLVLAAATYGEFDSDRLRSIAEQTDVRARVGAAGVNSPIAADMAEIVVTNENALEGLAVNATLRGREALAHLIRYGELRDATPGFIDGCATDFCTEGQECGTSWVALYRSDADAEAAFSIFHGEMIVGWGMGAYPEALGFGEDDGYAYRNNMGAPHRQAYVWRKGNLVLGVLGAAELGDALRSLAEGMEARSR